MKERDSIVQKNPAGVWEILQPDAKRVSDHRTLSVRRISVPARSYAGSARRAEHQGED